MDRFTTITKEEDRFKLVTTMSGRDIFICCCMLISELHNSCERGCEDIFNDIKDFIKLENKEWSEE